MEWIYAQEPVTYPDALAKMAASVDALKKPAGKECVWFLEHPPLYTAGSSAKEQDLLNKDFLPIFKCHRGGQYTYHGPGQRVVYLMLDLKTRILDVHLYVEALEEWIIQTLAVFDVRGERRAGRRGVWVTQEGKEKKIAAIGVSVRQGITSHGIALNVCPNLDHYVGIVPCGLHGYGVTSLHDLGVTVDLAAVDRVLKEQFMQNVFLFE